MLSQPTSCHPPAPFSLAETCGPVAWARGRWPNVDWRDGGLIWTGWEDGAAVWRHVRQRADGGIDITGSDGRGDDLAWASRVLGLDHPCPTFADPVIEAQRRRYPGIRAFSAGSILEGLTTSIIGQSISVAAAAVVGSRFAALFAPPVEIAGRRFFPMPRAEQVAAAEPALIRGTGVTWRRAAALVAAAQASLEGRLPDAAEAASDPNAARAALRALPLVGPWTAESALLWGIGLADAYPSGDVALLRAARAAYGIELTMRELDQLAEGWRPARAWACRLLWTALLGAASPVY